MKRISGWSLGALALFLAAGCSASVDEAATSTSPPVEPVGVHATCIDPCLIRYEVRLPATVTNGTYRPSSEITPLVLDAMRTELATRSDIDVDEGRDPTTSAHALYLAASVPSLVYSSGNLSATVELRVYTYPGLSLLGNITKRVTATGVYPFDKAKENLVISTAATQATRQFITNIGAY